MDTDALLTPDHTMTGTDSDMSNPKYGDFNDLNEITPPGTPDLNASLLKTSFTSLEQWNRPPYALTPPSSQPTTTYTTPEVSIKPPVIFTPPTSEPRSTFTTPGLIDNKLSQQPLTPPNSQPRDSHHSPKKSVTFNLPTPPATSTPRPPFNALKFHLPRPDSPPSTNLLLSSSSPSSSPSPYPQLCSKCTTPLSLSQSPSTFPSSTPSSTSSSLQLNTTLPCKHTLCVPCIRKLFRYSLFTHPFRGLPICCSDSKPIPLSVLGQISKPAEFTAYCDKLREVQFQEQEQQDRKMYCWKEECGMFISVWNQSTCSGTCPRCGERTCRLCGGRAHMFGGLGVFGRKQKGLVRGRRDGKEVRMKVRVKGRGKWVFRGVGMCPPVRRGGGGGGDIGRGETEVMDADDDDDDVEEMIQAQFQEEWVYANGE